MAQEVLNYGSDDLSSNQGITVKFIRFPLPKLYCCCSCWLWDLEMKIWGYFKEVAILPANVRVLSFHSKVANTDFYCSKLKKENNTCTLNVSLPPLSHAWLHLHLTVLPTYHKQEKLKIPTSLYHPVIHKWHIWAANPRFYVPTQVIAVTARLLKAKQCCGLDNASSHEGRKGKGRLGVGAKKWRRQMIVWVSQVNHCYHTCSLFVDFFFH